MELPSDLVDVGTVARLWGTHVSAVYRQLHSNKLPAFRICGRWRVSKADALGHIRRTGPGAVEGKARAAIPRISHADAVAVLRGAGVIRD